MSDTTWKTLYDIECVDKDRSPDSWMYDSDYYIIDRVSKERIYGPYRDFTYTQKQARHKYRKLVRSMERALMS